MSRSRENKIIDALNDKGVNLPCPRCSTSSFSILGESEMEVKALPSKSGGLLSQALFSHKTVSTVLLSCDNCGYILQHAQAPLGILQRRGISVLLEDEQ